MTMTAPTTPTRLQPPRPDLTASRPPERRGVRRVLLESAYALSAFPIALVGFVLVVVDLSLGLALSILVGGVLLLSVGVMVARGFARFERIRMREMLGRQAVAPVYVCPRPGDSFWRRSLTPLRDPQSWLDVVWTVVGLVTALVAFVVTLVWWAGALGGLTYWFWQRYIPVTADEQGLAELLGLGDGRTTESVLNLVLGAAFLLTLPWAVRLVATMHSGLAWLLVSSRGDLQGEVARVTSGRDAARAAESESLRRLERDIHDGPQQRLVRLTMDISRAKRQVSTDPQKAEELLDEALLHARETVSELRSLSRGIAPPLLVDRGLGIALAEMANQATVPVESHIDVARDLPPHVETAVYFAVAEALTNVAKHSEATHVGLTVRRTDDAVEVRVVDDGRGGAHPTKGQGLSGLAQRLAAVEGSLTIDSPVGGPTTLAARVPVEEPR